MSKNQYDLKQFYTSIIRKNPLRFGYQFIVQFFSSPGSPGFYLNNDPNDPKYMFTYYVQTTSIPKVEIGSAKVAFLAAGFEVPSVVKYPESWTVDILIDQGMTQYNNLLHWQEQISSYRNSQGGTKTIPQTYAKLTLLDSSMRETSKKYTMMGVWIQQLGELQFEYKEGSTQISKCKCTFALQYWYERRY